MRHPACTATCTATLLLLAGSAARGQAPSTRGPAESHTTARRIARAERGLVRAVAVLGRPETTYTLAGRMRRYGVPGVSIAVIEHGRLAWARGYGVMEAGRTAPVDTATLFQAGSVSKAVASVVALRLVQRGVLDLDGDVNRALVTWRVPVAGAEPVTLRRLLSHSAGLNVPSFPGYAAGAPLPTLPQLLDGLPPANTPAVRVTSPPGAAWRYSGGGTMVVQQLLVDVGGEPFEQLVRRELLTPAGMVHSTFEQPLGAARAARAATGHSPADTPLPGRWRAYPELAAAGLWSTAADLARFALTVQASLREGTPHRPRGGHAPRLLEPALADRMLTAQAGAWGLGFSLAGTGPAATFAHAGSTAGYTCRVLAFRDGRGGVVVMTNGESEALIDEIVRSVAHAHGWPVAPRPAKRVATTLVPADYVALAGRYRIDLGDRTLDVVVTAGARRLAFIGASGRPAELLPESATQFFTPESGTEFTFVRGPGDTRATALRIDQAGQQFTARRLP